MRFILFVEGRTERDSAAAFLKRWLDPQLSRPVGMQTVSFDGYADWRRKVATKARMHLEGSKHTEIIAVIGLLDLYGPQFYPDHLTTADERYEWGVAHFEKEVGLERFRMYFAVHEFEAWLLAQPGVFTRDIMGNLPRRIALPEAVNFDEPPAKLLDRVYKQTKKTSYKKTTYGKQLFPKLDPEIAAQKVVRTSIMVCIALPGERWEVNFYDDGDVAVEVFKSDGYIYDKAKLATLFGGSDGQGDERLTQALSISVLRGDTGGQEVVS